jgi:hypothetical protein
MRGFCPTGQPREIPGSAACSRAQIVRRRITEQPSPCRYPPANGVRRPAGTHSREPQPGRPLPDERGERVEQPVQRRALSDGNVVNLVQGGSVRRQRRAQIRLHRVRDKAEVAAGFAVAVDRHRLAARDRADPTRDHRGVGALRILPRAEDVEVPQSDRLHAVAARENIGIELVDVLGYRVRRERAADHVLHLGQRRMVAVGRARGRVHEAPHARFPGGSQHVHKPGRIRSMGGERIGDRARHRAERRVMQNGVDAFARAEPEIRCPSMKANRRQAPSPPPRRPQLRRCPVASCQADDIPPSASSVSTDATR